LLLFLGGGIVFLERNNMNKFKIDDSVKSIYGFGVVHDISANGSKYLVDDDEGFSWIKEEELVLVSNNIDDNM